MRGLSAFQTASLRLDCISLLAGETREGTRGRKGASGVLREPLVHGHCTFHRHHGRLAYA
jgi:hypothetical protein